MNEITERVFRFLERTIGGTRKKKKSSGRLLF